jgi:Holliday junction resolvase RusA-like endonuclease
MAGRRARQVQIRAAGDDGGEEVKVSLTILGEPASKANKRQLVTIANRPALIKSKKALAYEKGAAPQIPQSARLMLTGPVRVTLRIYYASERPDLDESLVLDVLQARYSGTGGDRHLQRAGVYGNDRQVREKHIYHAIDKRNPRAEIEVEEIAYSLFETTPEVAAPLPRAHSARSDCGHQHSASENPF